MKVVVVVVVVVFISDQTAPGLVSFVNEPTLFIYQIFNMLEKKNSDQALTD